MVKKKEFPFLCDIIHRSNFCIIQPAWKCIRAFSEKTDGWFLHSCCAFYAWSYKGHSLFDWGRVQHCGQCCCLHAIFNLFTECTPPSLVIRVCTALLQFRVSIKFRNMSSFPAQIFQKIWCWTMLQPNPVFTVCEMFSCSAINNRPFKIPPSTVAPHPDTQHIFPSGNCSPKLGRQIGSMWPI